MDEKREDHPLHSAFREWMRRPSPPGDVLWDTFIAGANAMEEKAKSPSDVEAARFLKLSNMLLQIIAAQPAETVNAKLDKIIGIAETPSLASEAVTKIDRLMESVASSSIRINTKLDTLISLRQIAGTTRCEMLAKIDRLLAVTEEGTPPTR